MLYVAVPPPPAQKHTTPDLAANSSWSLFPQNYFQEVLVNICRGINKPQEKTSWGYAVDVFSEPSFPFCSSTTLPGGGNGPLFFIQLQLGTRLGV